MILNILMSVPRQLGLCTGKGPGLGFWTWPWSSSVTGKSYLAGLLCVLFIRFPWQINGWRKWFVNLEYSARSSNLHNFKLLEETSCKLHLSVIHHHLFIVSVLKWWMMLAGVDVKMNLSITEQTYLKVQRESSLLDETLFIFYYLIFVFLGLHPRHIEAPRLGVQLEV